jgi:endonuclease/exonuclease/phosphatase family metal-dependent hydrolase
MPAAVLSALLALLLASCGDGGTGPSPDVDVEEAPDLADDGVELPPSPPLTIATWNLKQFPASSSTVDNVAMAVQQLGLDVVAFQEIQNTSAFDSLVRQLAGYDAVVYGGPYDDLNRIAVVWRTSIVSLRRSDQILTEDTYAFPRAPVLAEIEVLDAGAFTMDFTLIAVHLKAGTDATDEQSRTRAFAQLSDFVGELVGGPGDDEVIIIGDFNEAPTDDDARTVFAPFLSRTDLFRVLTWDLDVPREATYLPGGVVLDHMVSTAQLDDDIGAAAPTVPALEDEFIGYIANVSDHRPVVLTLHAF